MNTGGLRGQLSKGATVMLVLSVLADGEAYGYEIARRIAARSDGVFLPSEGALYPALHRLEAEGAVTATWHDGERGPRRRFYRITPAGRGLLTDCLREWSAMSRALGVVALGPADA